MPAPNKVASLDFLRWWSPAPWVLVSIHPDQQEITCETLRDEESVRRFLTEHGSRNIYFVVNPLLQAVSRKPSREDVKELAWLHVDIDPQTGKDLDQERARILAALQNPPNLPPPSAIVFSGGGYQAFWRLEQPVPINGQEELYEGAKRYNLQLELLLGGDSCHNVDRIMRLPGTVNWPNAKKRERGRVPELAKVVELRDHTYPISLFIKAPDLQSSGGGFSSGSTVKVSDNVRRVLNLDELPKGVSDYCKMVISQGSDPDNPNKWPSRSECLWWVCCELVRQGATDDQIYAIITDQGWGISGHVLAQGRNARRTALRNIERAREAAVDPKLVELNDQYAVARIEGRVRVISEERDVIGGQERTRIHYMSFADFANYYCNQQITWQVPTRTGGTQTMSSPLGKWWITHALRRQYDCVVFSPERDIPGAYNLWRGFAFEPRPGRCQLYLDHLRDVVCCGNQEHYDYLIRWMALCVQKPAQPGHVAVVLRGGQGTGKGAAVRLFGALFGRHYVTVRESNHLFGQFNAHMRDCLVLFADEAFWAGNKKHEGLLKSLVTEESMMSEGKGRDAIASQNYVHLIMASNEEWVVPVDVDDRRFFVLDVSRSHRQDVAYFRRMLEEMQEGGYSALLHHLLTLDLTGFEVRKVPKTAALREQKEHTFSAEMDWWFGKLRDGKVLAEHEGWESQVLALRLQNDFVLHCRAWGGNNRATATKMGRLLQRVIPGKIQRVQIGGDHVVAYPDGQTRVVRRPYAYEIPDLESCRAHWDAEFGGPYEWVTAPLVELEKGPF